MPNEISLMATAIVNSRDFCGDEKQAALEAALELGFTGKQAIALYPRALEEANATWRKSQIAAGVKRKYWRY